MSKIYTHEQTAKIFAAMKDIELANNGYAFIGHIIGKDADVAQALTSAGYKVITAPNLHGRMEYKGFTARAAESLSIEHFSMPAVARTPRQWSEAPDYEGAILARQESRMMDY
jgi:RIO-like serine/threonine protein kinase